MATNPVNIPADKPKAGWGGLVGKIAGGVLGAVGGAFGGPGGAMAGAGLGSSVGETVGGIADPGKAGGQTQGPSMIDSAIKRDPALQIGALTMGQESLRELGLPQEKELELHNNFEEAKKRISSLPWGKV